MDWIMTWFDYIIIAILVLSIVIALLRGFIREAASLVTWILGIVLGVSFAPALSQYIGWTGSVPVKYICSFFAVFLLVFIVGTLVGKLIKKMSYAIGLGVFDHILGFVFGVARGGIICSLIIMLIGTTPYAKGVWFERSMSVYYSQGIVAWSERFLPKGVEHIHQWLGSKNNKDNIKQIVHHAHKTLAKAKQHVNKLGS